MRSDTLRILEELTYQYQRVRTDRDPEWRELEQRRADLHNAFLKAHRGNHALLHQVNDLLDAQGALAECQNEFRFFLGLQMGLELGSLDLLREAE